MLRLSVKVTLKIDLRFVLENWKSHYRRLRQTLQGFSNTADSARLLRLTVTSTQSVLGRLFLFCFLSQTSRPYCFLIIFLQYCIAWYSTVFSLTYTNTYMNSYVSPSQYFIFLFSSRSCFWTTLVNYDLSNVIDNE